MNGRGLNEESKETVDSMRNRAHINAKKTKMRTESRKSTAVLCYVEIEQKEKKRKVWMENGATKECEARVSCPTAERRLRRTIQVSVKSR